MNTHTAASEILYKELVFKVVGCAMQIQNTLGAGLREKTYENALCVEFKHTQINYSQQERFPVLYRDIKVDEFIPDLIIENKIILDTKVVEAINDEHRGQIINYLKITQLSLGLIINFKHPTIQWERIVLERPK